MWETTGRVRWDRRRVHEIDIKSNWLLPLPLNVDSQFACLSHVWWTRISKLCGLWQRQEDGRGPVIVAGVLLYSADKSNLEIEFHFYYSLRKMVHFANQFAFTCWPKMISPKWMWSWSLLCPKNGLITQSNWLPCCHLAHVGSITKCYSCSSAGRDDDRVGKFN